MKSKLSANVTLWVNRLLAAAVAVLIFTMPALLEWYQGLRPLGLHGAASVMFGFYLCVPAVLYAFWNIDALLRWILNGRVFVEENVRRLRRVRWCCAAVTLICIPAACFYQPLVFMVTVMGFLTLMMSVVKNVMAAAVELREENDLTV